jgi:hypothetical protein
MSMADEEKSRQESTGAEKKKTAKSGKPSLPPEERKKLMKSMLVTFLVAAGVGILLALVTFFAIRRHM